MMLGTTNIKKLSLLRVLLLQIYEAALLCFSEVKIMAFFFLNSRYYSSFFESLERIIFFEKQMASLKE